MVASAPQLAFKLENGNIKNAVKHYILAATQGQGDDYLTIVEMFKEGFVSKDDLPLLFVHTRHQASVDATKSPQREVVEEFRR